LHRRQKLSASKIKSCTTQQNAGSMAGANIKLGENEPDERRAKRYIAAANAWLILAHGIRTLELKAKARKIALAAK